MPNPTTAKPTTAELLSSDPLFASIKAKVPLVATATGLHREVVNNKASRPSRWINSSDQMMSYGPAPVVNPTGFAPGGTSLGPSLVFGHGRQQLRFAGSGWSTHPTVCSAFAVFRPIAPSGTTNGTWSCWAVASAADLGAHGIGFTATSAGVLTLAALRSQGAISSGLTLTSGHWYAAWATFDDSGATKFVNFWLYDFTSQTLLSAAGGVGTQISAGASNAFASSAPDLMIGSLDYASGTTMPFLGEIADAGLYGGAGSDTLFTGYLTDPWSLVRGPAFSSASGTLTAGEAWPYDATTTQLMVGATRPTGGTTPYSYQWYGSQAGNFTPGAGNLISGATSLNLTWTPPTAGIWFLKLVATDSAGTPATVTYQQVLIGNYPKGDLKILSIGDSIKWSATGMGVTTSVMAATLYESGRRVIVHPRGITGASTSSSSWGPTGPLLAGAVADAVADGITDAEIMLGANDAVGTSAATYQANLQAIINYLSANGILRIWVHYPMFYQQPLPANDGFNTLLATYPAAIDALAAANPGLVFVGDKLNAQANLIDAFLFSGPHPGNEAALRVGIGWARAILATVDGGVAPAGFRRTTFNGGF